MREYVMTGPLLEGGEADLAMSAALRLAEGLRQEDVLAQLPPGLHRGLAGLALFYGYLALVRPGEGWEMAGEQLLERELGRLSQAPLTPRLFDGFTGVAWAVDHLQRNVFGGAEDFHAEVDALLLQWLERRPFHGPFDLVAGIVGIGLYGLGRGLLGAGRELATAAVRCLAETTDPRTGNAAWHSGPGVIPPWLRPAYPEGFWDLGLAHGVPGAVAFLARAVEAGVAQELAEDLLDRAVPWLLAQRWAQPDPLHFPRARTAAGEVEPTRYGVSWCYGDLSVAFALLRAGRCMKRPEWEREGLRLAREGASRRPQDVGMEAAGLCHGAAGAMHLFNRLHRATGEVVFRDAAGAWFHRLMELWDGAAGRFRGLESSAYPDLPAWYSDAGFLVGESGIGLSLLAAVASEMPAWDEILLVDLPA